MRSTENNCNEIFYKYKQLGGVIDYYMINDYQEKNELHKISIKDHLKVVKTALLTTSDDFESNYFTDVDKILIKKALKISLKDFFGPYYNISDNSVLFELDNNKNEVDKIWFTKSKIKHCNKYNNYLNKVIEPPSIYTLGFTYAFFYPPYGFGSSLSIEIKYEFFHEFLKNLFFDLNNIEIFIWAPDNNTYFDNGKEWWGCYFYTIYDPGFDRFVAILASTTD